MEISDNEIKRLMEVVSPDVRECWDKAKGCGKSLIEVQELRAQALENQKRNDRAKKRLYWGMTVALAILLSSLALVPIVLRMPFSKSIMTIEAIISGSCLIIFIVVSGRLESKHEHIENMLFTCDSIFKMFKQSVDRLGSMSIAFHSGISTESINAALVRTASDVIYSQKMYETLKPTRLPPRDRMIKLVEFMTGSEKAFNNIWNTVQEEFPMKLDKNAIYADAGKVLKEINPELFY